MKDIANDSDCMNCEVYKLSVFHASGLKTLPARTRKKFRRGEQLFGQNSPSHGVFCLRSGKVNIFKVNDADKRMLAIAEPGEILGVSSILSQQGTYTTTAVAAGPVSACVISKEEFRKLVSSSPKVMFNTLQMLVQKLNKLDDVLTE